MQKLPDKQNLRTMYNSAIKLFLVLFYFTASIYSQNSALSMHMWSDDTYDSDIITKTLKVPHKTLYTYYCAMNWNTGVEAGGYCGIQNHPSGNAFIFSIWDPIASKEPIKAAYTGKGTEVERFGGEGTGLKSMNFELGWAEGNDYQLVARVWDAATHTYFGYWVYDVSSKNWTHLITMDYPVSKIRFKGSVGSFLEDWMSTGENMRMHMQKNVYKRKLNKSWFAVNRMNYSINTYDIATGRRSYNYRTNYDAGLQDGYYYMKSGGTTKPGFSGTGVALTNNTPASPSFESIKFYFTEASETKIMWSVPQSSTPQFRVKIESGGAVLLDSISSQLRSFSVNSTVGKQYDVTIEDILGNETKNTIITGSNSLVPKIPAGLKINSLGSNQAAISWTAVQNAEKYLVQIQKDKLWFTAEETGSTLSLISRLKEGSSCKIRVAAKNNYGEGEYCDYITVKTTLKIIPNTSWKLVYVDSQETAGEDGRATNAFDGKENTFWHTAWSSSEPKHPHQIQIDMGAVYYNNGFKYLPRQDGGTNGIIYDYELYISEITSDWGTAVAKGKFEKNSLLKEITFPEKKGRYFKLVALSEIGAGAWTSAAELMMVGDIVSSVNTGQEILPSDYKLENPYPNPFNPVTKINFSVPKSSKVKISIYDILGNKVDDLMNSELVPGKYNINWNAAGQASGVYFCIMKSENFIKLQKLVLVK